MMLINKHFELAGTIKKTQNNNDYANVNFGEQKYKLLSSLLQNRIFKKILMLWKNKIKENVKLVLTMKVNS